METLQAEASLQGIQVNHKLFAEMNVQKKESGDR